VRPPTTIVAPRPAASGPWPIADGWLPLTEHSVERIVALDDPALRNLWITQSYADLGRRLLLDLGPDQSWCSFATWTSCTAGVALRAHTAPRVVETLLVGVGHHADAVADAVNDHSVVGRRLVRRFEGFHLERAVTRALARLSAEISDAATTLFAELAPPFVRFAEALERSVPPSIEELLLASGSTSSDTPPLVALAFRHYAVAVHAGDEARRAEHVLLANVAMTVHEQHRLQEAVAHAADPGLVDVGVEVAEACRPSVPDGVRESLARRAVNRSSAHVEAVWGHIVGELLMTIVVPGEMLLATRDVPPLPDGTRCPPPLARPQLPALVELLAEWDPTGGAGRGSAATDWDDLRQRVGFLVDLVRSRQRSPQLTQSPFTADQVAVMVRNRLPATLRP
jgi:hypothetical protein